MRTRLPQWSQGFVRRLTRVALVSGGGLALAMQGCDRGPTSTARAGGGPVHLAFSTSVVAAPGAVVEAIVSHTVNGSATELSRDSVITDTGGADAALSLTANVSSCVDAAPTGGSCVLNLVVRLKRNGAVLDEATQQLTVGADTESITAAPVQLYEVASVSITGPAAALAAFEPRDVIQLTATALDRNGATVAGRAATWSVASGGVTVGASTGSMTAVTVGQAVVRAAMGGRTHDMSVTVKQTSVDTVRVAPADTSITIGNSFTYRVTLKSGYNDVLTGRPLTYTSSNAAIATVSSTGVANGISAGTATITVTSLEGRGGTTRTGTAILRVQPRPQIVVTPAALTFQTALLTPLPPAQTVAITNPGGGTVDPISVVTTDTVVVATLDRTTVPATLTVRATTPLAAGTSLQREVRVRSGQSGVADGVVTVTVQGIAVAQGMFSGQVINANTAAPIAGASVTIRRASDNAVVTVATTSTNGAWTSIALPAGTYSLGLAANGFTSVNVAQVTLTAGPNIPVTTVAPVSLVPTGTGGSAITGVVRDATTNLVVAAATVELRAGANNVTGTPISSGPTDANGRFAFPLQPAGTYTIRVAKTGYADGLANVSVSASSTESPTIFLSPATSGAGWRFVLQWGSQPDDLDAHLTGPVPNSQTRFHVYFADPGSLTTSPFAQLDFDVTDGLGPETMSIGTEFAGTYRFYVHNFSGDFGDDVALRSSGASVSVYRANTLVARYSVPQQDGVYWTVAEITNGTLLPINVIGNVAPSIKSPVVGPRNSAKASEAAAAAEWFSLAPWNWQALKKRR